MAKQIGDIKITGTVAGITFYKMDGQYYARKKSSLSGKRVKRDPKFRRTMHSAERLARASQLASKVYRGLPGPEQVYALFKELKSLSIRALKEEKSEEEVLALLRQRVRKERPAQAPSAVRAKKTPVVLTTPPNTLFHLPGGRRKGVPARERRPTSYGEHRCASPGRPLSLPEQDCSRLRQLLF